MRRNGNVWVKHTAIHVRQHLCGCLHSFTRCKSYFSLPVEIKGSNKQLLVLNLSVGLTILMREMDVTNPDRFYEVYRFMNFDVFLFFLLL